MTLTRETTEFFDSRLIEVATALRREFIFLISDTAPDQIRGLAVVLDADGASLRPAVLRRSDLDELEADRRARRAEDETPDRDWELHWRWHPEAWPRSSAAAPNEDADSLAKTWSELVERRHQVSGSDEAYWPSVLFESAASAMAALFQDGFFDDYPHAHQVVRVLDDPGATQISAQDELRWISNCNNSVGTTSFKAARAQHLTGIREPLLGH